MVFILLTLVFLLMRVAPGNPVSASLGGHVPPAVIKQISHQLGTTSRYTPSTPTTLGHRAGRFRDDDLRPPPGGATHHRQRRATLELTFFAMVIALAVGLLVGLLSGRFRDTPIDAGGRLFGIVVYATPVFFLGLIAQLLFGVWPRLAADLGPGEPDNQAPLQTHTNIHFVDAIIDGNWTAALGHREAPDPAGDDPRLHLSAVSSSGSSGSTSSGR